MRTLHRWSWGGRAVQNKVFIDYKQILPNLPLIHPEKAVSSVCLAKHEDALGTELVQMKPPLFSSASFSTWQGSGVPSTAPPSLSSSWLPISLFIARMNPAWYPGCPEPGNFGKLSCPQPVPHIGPVSLPHIPHLIVPQSLCPSSFAFDSLKQHACPRCSENISVLFPRCLRN